MDFNYGIPFGSKVGKIFHSFLNPQEGYEAAEEQAQKYYKDAQGNLKPIAQQGQAQYGRLNNQADALGNPVQLENQWADSYNMSPYATHLKNQAVETGMDQASSMGLMGSSAALNNVQNSAGNIMQSDRQNYMNDLMQKYMQSIGIGENLYGTGAVASGAMSQNAMTQGQNMAGLAYGVKNAPGEMFGKLLGTAANAAVNYHTGGIKPPVAGGA